MLQEELESLHTELAETKAALRQLQALQSHGSHASTGTLQTPAAHPIIGSSAVHPIGIHASITHVPWQVCIYATCHFLYSCGKHGITNNAQCRSWCTCDMQPPDVLERATLDCLLQLPWLGDLADMDSLSAAQRDAAQEISRLTEQQMSVWWRVGYVCCHTDATIMSRCLLLMSLPAFGKYMKDYGLQLHC